MSTSEAYDAVVESDGSVRVPPDQVAGLGLRPGEHLRLVRDFQRTEGHPGRRSVRGLGVGRVAPEDVLSWEDFEAASEATVRAAEAKHGS